MGLEGFEFDEPDSNSNNVSRTSSRRSSQGGSRRRKSMLQPSLDLDHSGTSDASRDSDASVLSAAPIAPVAVAYEHEVLNESAENSVDTPYVINMECMDTSASQLDDATGTVMLPASLADVIILNNAPAVPSATDLEASRFSEASVEHTEQIEMNLGDLMRKLGADAYQQEDADVSMVSASTDGGNQRMSILEGMYMSVGDLSASQMETEEDAGALGSLIGRHSDASTIRTEGRLSTDSVQSQRSTRSRRSTGSAASEVSAVSTKSSKGKKGKKSATKAPKSPAPALVAEEEMVVDAPAVATELSVSNIHDLSTQSQDHTFGLEGSLGALMNNLANNAEAAVNVNVNDLSTQSQDHTFGLEGSLGALMSNLAGNSKGAAIAQESPAQSKPPQWTAEQDISVIVPDNEYNDDLECDFSALESPRRSTMVRDAVIPGSEQSQQSKRASKGSQASRRQSTRGKPKESLSFSDSHSDITHETFGDFSLMASTEDEAQIQALSQGNGGSLMDRLRNLNKGARSNTLLQAGTPTVRAESRMSIGLKRKSILNTTNLNSSLNMSVHQPAQSAVKSAVKSAKKVRKEESTPEAVKVPSPTPSMSNVYGGSPNTIRYAMNPMRGMPSIEEQGVPTETSMISTSEASTAEGDVSVLNKTTTNYEEITQNLRAKLYTFFAAAQTLRTVISTFPAEVQQIVRNAMIGNISAAYVDTPLSQVPLEGLLLAFELSAAQAEQFTQHVVATYPEAVKHQRVAFKSADADQLWVNMTAATILSNTSALKAAQEDSADKFFQKVLNKAPTAGPSDAAKLITAQQAAELSRVQQELLETTLLTDILNKLTYCRVTAFTSQCIKVHATLSPTVAASLVFNICRSGNALVVQVLIICSLLCYCCFLVVCLSATV